MVSQQHRPATRPPRRHGGGRRPICLAAHGDGFDLGTVLPLVRKEVRRFRPWRLEPADLMQAGVTGALEAWNRRDASRGDAFRAYTSSWVRKEVQRTVGRGEFTVAVPPHVPAAALELRRHLDHGTGLRAASRHLGVSAEQTASLERLLEPTTGTERHPIELEAIGDASPSVEETVLDQLDRDIVRRAVAKLSEPLRSVVALRFGFDGSDGRSTREIGRLVGVSDFTVRTHLKQATALLQARLAALR